MKIRCKSGKFRIPPYVMGGGNLLIYSELHFGNSSDLLLRTFQPP